MNHFFDIGANIGQTFDWFLLPTKEFDGWTIWCFEPSPRNVCQLLEKAKQLQERYTIIVCPFAITGSSRPVRIFQNENPIGDSLFEKYWVGNEESKNLAVNYQIMSLSVPLGEFISNHTSDGDNVVLKLDCEGSEYDALRNLIQYPKALHRCSRIMVEWHKTGRDQDDIHALKTILENVGHKLEAWNF